MTARLPCMRRLVAAGLLGALIVLPAPKGTWRAEAAAVLACGTGTQACCCGTAGGCGTCPTEQPTAAQRDTAERVLAQAGCTGPAALETAAPGGPKYVMAAAPQISETLVIARLSMIPADPPADVSPAPDPLPPRPNLVSQIA